MGCGPNCNVWINKYCCKTSVEAKDVCCDIARVPSDRYGKPSIWKDIDT